MGYSSGLLRGVPAMTKVIFGKSKCIDNIRLEEVLRHPIWVWALDEEGIQGQDETWQKPVINTTDVSESVADQLTGTIIAFKVVGTELYGSGDYDHRFGTIGCPWIWDDEGPMELRDIADLTIPVIFEAVPTICGESGVRFACPTPGAWEARRID